MHLIKFKVHQIYILKEQAKELKKKYYEGFGGNVLDPKDKKMIDKIEKDIKAAKSDIRKIAKNKLLILKMQQQRVVIQSLKMNISENMLAKI